MEPTSTETSRNPKQRFGFGDILVAVVVGFSKALGWEEKAPSEQIVALGPKLDTGDLNLTFGDLDPLED